MKIIAEGNSRIKTLWGEQKAVDTEYRQMKYLLKKEHKDGLLVQNVVTGQLILLDETEVSLLEQLPQKYNDQMDELVRNHFLVPTSFDEYCSVNQMRRIISRVDKTDKTDKMVLFTILPTTYCNARCFYCYESDFKHVQMTEEIAEQAVRFIVEKAASSKISLRWFGGEPLVGADRITQICEGLKSQGFEFKSSMISNGFLFDEKLIAVAVDTWKLKGIQITLDGTEQRYNDIKAYVGIKESAFKRVIKNIRGLLDNHVRVSIRLNIGFHNVDNLRELIDYLALEFKGYKNAHLYLGLLYNDKGFEKVHYSLQERDRLEQIKEDMMGYASLKGLDTEYDTSLPHLIEKKCMADNDKTVMICPDGNIGKCEHYFGEHIVGDVWHTELNKKEISWYKKVSDRPECPECCLYPVCILLSCCSDREPCSDLVIRNKCKIWEKNMEKNMEKKVALNK